MGKKLIIGRAYGRYRVYDTQYFSYKDMTLEEVRRTKGITNIHYHGNELIIENGMYSGVKSSNISECMNTYTVVGQTMGVYLIADFNGTEIFALRGTELHKNAELFRNKHITNGVILPKIGDEGIYTSDIVPIHAGFINNTAELAYKGRDYKVEALKFMQKVYEIRLNTLNNPKYKHDKIGNFNLKVIATNIQDIKDTLDNIDKLSRVDLVQALKNEIVKKPFVDCYFLNRGLYTIE